MKTSAPTPERRWRHMKFTLAALERDLSGWHGSIDDHMDALSELIPMLGQMLDAIQALEEDIKFRRI